MRAAGRTLPPLRGGDCARAGALELSAGSVGIDRTLPGHGLVELEPDVPLVLHDDTGERPPAREHNSLSTSGNKGQRGVPGSKLRGGTLRPDLAEDGLLALVEVQVKAGLPSSGEGGVELEPLAIGIALYTVRRARAVARWAGPENWTTNLAPISAPLISTSAKPRPTRSRLQTLISKHPSIF